ncbi:MAG: DUF4837 family protein [Bacteroidales bacterium]
MTRYLLILMATLLLGSCTSVEGPRKPSATGKTGEMLVVTPTARWNGHAGDIIREAFGSDIPFLMQPEPHFNLIQIAEQDFVKLFETHRNIFFVEFDNSLERGKIEVSRHVWSYPQRVIRLKVPDEAALQRIMDANTEEFITLYLETERERLINAYSRMMNHGARNVIREKFGLDITVPEGYFIAKVEEDFVWLRQTGTRDDIELGLMISVFPYTDATADFAPQTIWDRRNTMTRLHVPGSLPNSHMTTYPDIPPVFREINFNGKYAMEGRGFWRMHNDFMGGPFVSITFVNENKGQLVNLDGFVYRPNRDKRDLLRQVEALIYSVKPYVPGQDQEESEEIS